MNSKSWLSNLKKPFEKSKLLSFLVYPLILLSCIEKIEESPWSNEVVPVVFSAITPSEKIHVFVGESYSENNVLKNHQYGSTKVYVSEKDCVWIELSPKPGDSSIYVDKNELIEVKPGNTYLLRVEINDKTVYSQTTVPSESGEIIHGECLVVSDMAVGSTNGDNYTAYLCVINLKLKLPSNRNYGCYLTAFSQRIEGLPFLSSEIFQLSDFVLDKKISQFNINIITADPNLKKFMIAESVSSGMFDSRDISDIIGTYGGVYPSFSNIKNGIGLFGSFIKTSRLIFVTNKND